MQRHDGRSCDGRQAQRQRVVHDVGVLEVRAKRARTRGREGRCDQALRDGRRAAVLGRHLVVEPCREARCDWREQYLIVELAHLGEPVDEATCVRLAAAELSRHERQERDADDRHRDRS